MFCAKPPAVSGDVNHWLGGPINLNHSSIDIITIKRTIKQGHCGMNVHETHICDRCLAGRMAMHTCQSDPTDTAPHCPVSPLQVCVGTKGGTLWGRQPFCPHFSSTSHHKSITIFWCFSIYTPFSFLYDRFQ